MLGAAQRAWLEAELDGGSHHAALVVWANSVPWIAAPTQSGDHWDWGGYDDERRRLAAFIQDRSIENLVIVSGDAHMLAIDDGTNSPGRIPVLQAGSLDRHGSIKGGPYSEGAYPGGGQFALMTIRDDGNEIEVIWSGRDYLDRELVGLRLVFQ
jgi:phosphodiesterase/alkaline phosphatase D-like protein